MPGDTPLQYPFPYKTTDGSGLGGSDGILNINTIQSDSGTNLVLDGNAAEVHIQTSGVDRLIATDDYIKVTSTQNASDFDGDSGALRVMGGAFVGEDLVVAGEIVTQGAAESFTPGILIGGFGSMNVIAASGNYITENNVTMFDFLISVTYSSATVTELRIRDLPATQIAQFGTITNLYTVGLGEPVKATIMPSTNQLLLQNAVTNANVTLSGVGSFTIGGTGLIMSSGVTTYTPALSSGSGGLGSIIYGTQRGAYAVLGNVTVFNIDLTFAYAASTSTALRVSLPSTAAYASYADNVGIERLDYPMGGNIAASTSYISLLNPATGVNTPLDGSGLDRVIHITGFYYNNTATFTPTIVTQAGDAGTLSYPTQVGYRYTFGQAVFCTVNLTINYSSSDIQQYTVAVSRLAGSSKAVLSARSVVFPNVYLGGSFLGIDENYSTIIGTGTTFLRFSQMFITGNSGSTSTATFNSLQLTKSSGYAMQSSGAVSISENQPSQIVRTGFNPSYEGVLDCWAPDTYIPMIRLGNENSTYNSGFIGFNRLFPNYNRNTMMIGITGSPLNAIQIDSTGRLTVPGEFVCPSFGQATFFKPVLGIFPDANFPKRTHGVTLEYVTQVAYYIKTGDLISINFNIQFKCSAIDSSSRNVYITNLPYQQIDGVNSEVEFGPCVWLLPEGTPGSLAQPFYGQLGYEGEEDYIGNITSQGPFDGYTFKPYFKQIIPSVLGVPSITVTLAFNYYNTLGGTLTLQGSLEYMTNGTFNPHLET